MVDFYHERCMADGVTVRQAGEEGQVLSIILTNDEIKKGRGKAKDAVVDIDR